MDYLKLAKEAMAKLQQWDAAKAERLLADTYNQLAAVYPPGALEYAEQYCPKLDKEWLTTLDEIDQAYKNEDMAAFMDALSRHEEVCRNIFDAYRKNEGAF